MRIMLKFADISTFFMKIKHKNNEDTITTHRTGYCVVDNNVFVKSAVIVTNYIFFFVAKLRAKRICNS